MPTTDSPQTASAHLAKLAGAGLLTALRQGRHRYHRLASPSVARMMESIMQVAAELQRLVGVGRVRGHRHARYVDVRAAVRELGEDDADAVGPLLLLLVLLYGLALVYGIVIDSGGGIGVESVPGQGSRFSIYLPRVEAPALAADAAAGPLARGAGERVLVVDDEEALVAVTSEVLKRIGYEPLGCADGEAALAAVEEAGGRIDAVIADEVMPGLSGTQLARSLRRRRADLPVVLVSGYTGPMLSERALAAGVTEILKKPVQSRDLAAALARAVKRS